MGQNRDGNVLAAAISVMSERGYSAISIHNVADRVGVLKGSLHHYFSSKEELFFRLLDESHLEGVEIAAKVAALELAPLAELTGYLRRQSMWYLANVERVNIFFTESRNLTGDRLKITELRAAAFAKHVRVLITHAQQAGEIGSALDPRLLTRYLLGAMNDVRFWPSRSEPRFSKEQIVDAVIKMTLHALEAQEVVPIGMPQREVQHL
ncbi:MAG: TetR/AcrR family transcriptional regulator [Microbacteriaceae bacterium]|nr:TetR/AcrR family transcriptional regulator [Microbacteriaceae bacterium]